MKDDDQNLILAAEGQDCVDCANQEFYSKFPYPWPPMAFPRLEDPGFEAVMLNQSIGDFTQRTVPMDANVWVAGCGTNQAVYTALRFPKGSVIGSDLSSSSLEMSGRNADKLGIRNLTLRQESLNHVTYDGVFDYILCTGVIHHNAEPARVLANIARALRPHGVLELMVYNRFHRTFMSSFQKAVTIIRSYGGHTRDYARELDIAKSLAAAEPIASSAHMHEFIKFNDAHLADSLIQPVEYSYTVESLNDMAGECGLELMLPCVNQFDVREKRVWTMHFGTKELEEIVTAMPDVARWQVSNLLLLEKSPMLWFFLRHRTDRGDGRYEMRANEEFLARTFVPASTKLRNYFRGASDLEYKASSALISYPSEPKLDLVRKVVSHASGQLTMREILGKLGVDTASRKAITDIRTQTTTTLCPYLRAM